jgi:RNA polymerase sigma-70 factor (ECF subfamily)
VTVALRRSTPATPATDDDLAIAAATGDAAAFGELYARYAQRVFARITRLIGPGPDREDVLQQVFLELHRSLPRFRAESTVSTFLYRITINVAFNHLRRRRRRPAEYDAAELDELVDGAPTPEERARRREELGQIFALLEHIKPAKRIAFVLVAVEGLSLDEAAELVGAHPEAVKQRVLHARRELVAMMDRADRRALPLRRSP